MKYRFYSETIIEAENLEEAEEEFASRSVEFVSDAEVEEYQD